MKEYILGLFVLVVVGLAALGFAGVVVPTAAHSVNQSEKHVEQKTIPLPIHKFRLRQLENEKIDPEPILNPPRRARLSKFEDYPLSDVLMVGPQDKTKQGIRAVAPRPLPTARETVWSAYIAEQMGGVAEYKIDGGRVDILTDETAWEVEWATKIDEALGQAVRYAIATNRKGGVILLMGRGDKQKESTQLWTLRAMANYRGLDIQVIKYNVREDR